MTYHFTDSNVSLLKIHHNWFMRSLPSHSTLNAPALPCDFACCSSTQSLHPCCSACPGASGTQCRVHYVRSLLTRPRCWAVEPFVLCAMQHCKLNTFFTLFLLPKIALPVCEDTTSGAATVGRQPGNDTQQLANDTQHHCQLHWLLTWVCTDEHS